MHVHHYFSNLYVRGVGQFLYTKFAIVRKVQTFTNNHKTIRDNCKIYEQLHTIV